KGETKTITFTITAEDLKFYDYNLNFVAELGDFEVFVGPDSSTKLKTTFSLTE
ncbi:MAG: fibronectin type III-like domain-contianing protein, partial [Flavobacteriaceae bacterium]|nr:fibronectin type III-like domain-contianing protein [Flavobacteriaceae bacterium]